MRARLEKVFAPGSLPRDAAALAVGTLLANGITIAVTPLLTRIYTPAEFGVFAVYMAVVGLIAVLACLRYELAIVLPGDDREAAGLLALSLTVTVGTSAVALLLVALGGEQVSALMSMPALAWLLWLVPAAVLLRGWYQALNQQATRCRRIRQIAVSRTGQAATASAGQVAAGTAAAGPVGLAGGHLGGTLAGVLLLAYVLREQLVEAARAMGRWREVVALAGQYRAFPGYDAPAGLLNTGTYELPALILGAFFAGSVVGEFAVGMRVVMVPSVLITASLAQVFYVRAARTYDRTGGAAEITAQTIRTLLAIALPVYLALMASGPWLFSVVFGEAWREAGLYVSVLSPLCLLMFAVAPVSQLFFVFGRQNVLFRFQLMYFLMSAGAFAAGGLASSPLLAVALFSAFGTVRYLVMLVYIFRLAGLAANDLVRLSNSREPPTGR